MAAIDQIITFSCDEKLGMLGKFTADEMERAARLLAMVHRLNSAVFGSQAEEAMHSPLYWAAVLQSLES